MEVPESGRRDPVFPGPNMYVQCWRFRAATSLTFV